MYIYIYVYTYTYRCIYVYMYTCIYVYLSVYYYMCWRDTSARQRHMSASSLSDGVRAEASYTSV